MSKVERARSRASDGQEGWKDGTEDHAANKTSWADSADPRAPSPSSAGQFKSASQQDLQVDRNAEYVRLYASKPISLHLVGLFGLFFFPGW